MKYHFSAIAFAAVATFSACLREDSESVNQDRIFTEYELFYNASEDKTYARATFKFGNALGAKLQLSEGSEVMFNGDLLTFKPLLAYWCI